MGVTYTVRTMRREELPLAIDWARGEGWNPGIHDAEAFYAADPDGFLIGLADNVPAATISAVRYGSDFGFLGLYIVRREFRGRGYGLTIWREACRRLEGRVAGLDGVVAQQENYRRSGFEFHYRHIRFQGMTRACAASDGVRMLTGADFEVLNALDRSCFGAERGAFLRTFCFAPGSRVAGVEDSRGKPAGYGVIRPCFEGWKLGPVFASDAESARRLVTALTATGSAEHFYWDIPEPNAAALRLAGGEFGMTPMFETARMYRGGSWKLPLERIWGATTLELG